MNSINYSPIFTEYPSNFRLMGNSYVLPGAIIHIDEFSYTLISSIQLKLTYFQVKNRFSIDTTDGTKCAFKTIDEFLMIHHFSNQQSLIKACEIIPKHSVFTYSNTVYSQLWERIVE
jgi:hypothetical protein